MSTASQSIRSGCQSDIASGNALAVALNAILSDYNSTRGLFCSQSTSNGTYCLPSTLQNIQTATGQNITLNTLSGLVSGNGLGQLLTSVPNSAVCTDVRPVFLARATCS